MVRRRRTEYTRYKELMKSIQDLRDEQAIFASRILKLWEYIEAHERNYHTSRQLSRQLPRPPLPSVSIFPPNIMKRRV
jgi:hypothetical protein